MIPETLDELAALALVIQTSIIAGVVLGVILVAAAFVATGTARRLANAVNAVRFELQDRRTMARLHAGERPLDISEEILRAQMRYGNRRPRNIVLVAARGLRR